LTIGSKDKISYLLQRANFGIVFLQSIDGITDTNKSYVELLFNEEGEELAGIIVDKATE
jgi:hypothetical protein